MLTPLFFCRFRGSFKTLISLVLKVSSLAVSLGCLDPAAKPSVFSFFLSFFLFLFLFFLFFFSFLQADKDQHDEGQMKTKILELARECLVI